MKQAFLTSLVFNVFEQESPGEKGDGKTFLLYWPETPFGPVYIVGWWNQENITFVNANGIEIDKPAYWALLKDSYE